MHVDCVATCSRDVKVPVLTRFFIVMDAHVPFPT